MLHCRLLRTVLRSRLDRLESLSRVNTFFQLLGPGSDAAELVLETTGSAGTVKSRHHLVLSLGDGCVVEAMRRMETQSAGTIFWAPFASAAPLAMVDLMR